MNNTIEPPPKRLKKYRKYLGPSQFAVVLGLDDYQTAESLKDEIENGYVPSSTYATQYGNDNESIAIYYYQKLYNVATQKPLFVVDMNNKHIGGICDALIDEETGLEIKCHIKDENLLTKIPMKYLLQLAGYMYLYKRKKWILMSATFNGDKTLNKYVVHTVTWDQVKDQWEQLWYPKIIQYVDAVKWVS
jgi:predicted phage-related endonuclease